MKSYGAPIQFYTDKMRWLPIAFVFINLFVGAVYGQDQDSTQTSDQSLTQLIDSTEVLRFSRAIIIGNKKTLDQIILRELTLKPGDTASRIGLKKILQLDKIKIYNLRIFTAVNLRVLDLPDKTFELLIEVEERWFYFPVPIFELSDRNFNEWWQNYDHKFNRVNYGLRWYQYNFRGRNEYLRLTAQFGFSRKFDITYRIPYIDKKQKQGLIFDLSYAEPKNLACCTQDHKLVFVSGRETLRKRLAFSVTYTFRKSFYETHGFSFDFSNGSIADTIFSRNPNYYANEKVKQQVSGISYQFSSEHRDVIAYPLNGYQLSGSIRQLGLWGKPSQTIMTGSVAYHKGLGRNFFFSNLTSGYFATPNNQPYSFFYGLGYNKFFVRGYEIYVIEGPMYALTKTTLKKRIFSRTYRLDDLPWEQFQLLPIAVYLKAYADLGYVKNYPSYESQFQNTQLSNKMIAGVGLGLDLVTSYDSAFRLEYTMNRAGDHGFFFHLKKEF